MIMAKQFISGANPRQIATTQAKLPLYNRYKKTTPQFETTAKAKGMVVWYGKHFNPFLSHSYLKSFNTSCHLIMQENIICKQIKHANQIMEILSWKTRYANASSKSHHENCIMQISSCKFYYANFIMKISSCTLHHAK